MNCRVFELNHPDEDCNGPLINVRFCLMPDFSIVIVGDCAKCAEADIGLKYSLSLLVKWVKELRKKERPALQAPIQLPEPTPAKFTEADEIELHALGVKLPDEATQ